jgi:hypothetical protein
MSNQDSTDVLIDSRFHSFHKCLIVDILSAGLDKMNDLKLLKINNLYMSKVMFSGLVVSIFENNKFYRIKVDDSTGCISCTLWKALIFDGYQDDRLNDTDAKHNPDLTIDAFAYERDLDEQLRLIQKHISQPNTNRNIMYLPEQGQMVSIRGYAKSYRDTFEINVVSCNRIEKSNEEYLEMILPIVLHEKCYAKRTVSRQFYENLVNRKDVLNKEIEQNKVNLNEQSNKLIDETLRTLVHNVLIELTKKLNMTNDDFLNRKTCDSKSVHIYIREKYAAYKNLSHLNVIQTLKELEIKGKVYSCDDDMHYVPVSL